VAKLTVFICHQNTETQNFTKEQFCGFWCFSASVAKFPNFSATKTPHLVIPLGKTKNYTKKSTTYRHFVTNISQTYRHFITNKFVLYRHFVIFLYLCGIL